jgi:hypothetical protein
MKEDKKSGMENNLDPNMVETLDQVYECYETEHSMATVRWLHPMFQNGTYSKDNSCQPPNPGELLTKEEFYNEMNTNSELYKEWGNAITALYFYISKQNKNE